MLLTSWLLVSMAASPLPPVEEPPKWVEPVEIPALSGTPEGGSHTLLVDLQARLGKQREWFVHQAWKVLTVGGVEALAKQEFEWDPTWSKLTLHGVWIWRDGKRRVAWEPEDARVVQRETNRTESLYDGRLTLIVELRDLRPGDIVETSSTITGENPVFDGHVGTRQSPTWLNDVTRSRLRVVWERERPLNLKAVGTVGLPAVTKEEGATVYRWDAHDAKGTHDAENHAPDDVVQFPYVEFSDWKDWNEVARWATKLFAVPATGARFDEEVKRFKALPDAGRAEAIVRFVQDDIRYVGVELGTHSHQPHAPEWVLERGFGDCKDKALLLTSLLRAVGLEAWPVLASTDEGLLIQRGQPSATVFNHAIVKVQLPDGARFVDGTRTRERGPLKDRMNPNYGWALVVRDDTQALEQMVVERPKLPSWELEQQWRPKRDGRLSITLTTTVREPEAASMRDYLLDTRREEVVKAKQDQREKSVEEKLTFKSFSWEDDEANNVITLREEYELPHLWNIGVRSLGSMAVIDEIERVSEQQRKVSRRLRFPAHTRETLLWVSDTTLDSSNFDLEPTNVEQPSFRFASQRSISGRELTMSWEYEALKDRIEPGELAGYRTSVDKVWESLGYEVQDGLTEKDDPKEPFWKKKSVHDFFYGLVGIGVLALIILLRRRETSAPSKPSARTQQFRASTQSAPGEVASSPARVKSIEHGFKLFTSSRCPRGHAWGAPVQADTVRLGDERIAVLSRRCTTCDAREDRYVKVE